VNAYRTVVVGTDGPESFLRAVRRAGAPAGACGARRVIACAHLPTEADDRELNTIRGRLPGSVPADATRRPDVDVLVVHTTD
jgi:hypothetical protein